MGQMNVRDDITPFMFPCPTCSAETFHVVAEEYGGFTLGTVFSKKPLFATQRANQVICTRCETINGRLTPEDVRKMADGFIPKSIHAMYPRVAEFYSLDKLRELESRFADNPVCLSEARDAIKAYRLEL